MLGDGYQRKKKTLELIRGEKNNTDTPVTRNSHIPLPLSQLSDWVRLPPPKTHAAHFTPYTAYSSTPSTCQIGFSYCCHKFCLPTQSHNAFNSSFLSTTTHTLKPSIVFLSSLFAPPLPCLPALLIIPATTCDTYNPSNPLAVWACSNCWRDNFFCLTDNICCTCYKPRYAPNPRAPPRIVYHDPDYFTDDDTTITLPHRYTMYKEPDYSCEHEALSWETVSDFSCEESEWGSMPSVDFEQPTHTVLPIPPLLTRNTHIHKSVHIQPTPSVISPPISDIVRATHTLNFLLHLPTPSSTKIIKGCRLHLHVPIVSNTPYTLTPSARPIASTHAMSYTCPLTMFVHKHIQLVATALALHVTFMHKAQLVQIHAHLHTAITHRKMHTQRPVCFASNPSYASSSSMLSCFQASVFIPFFHFLMLFSIFSASFPHTALVVGVG